MLRIVAVRRIIEKYFNWHHDIQVQVFNLMTLSGILTGIVVTALAIIIKEDIRVIGINILNSALAFALLCIANRKKCYHLCSWLLIISIFIVAFPLLFFYCGGYKGGAGFFFLIAITSTAVLLDRYERAAAILLELSLYLACLLLAYYRPMLVSDLSTEFSYILVMALNFMVTCVFILVVTTMRSRIIEYRQAQIQELNRELLIEKETLARYDKMKSDFLATVAHEINTPLAVIAASSSDTLDLLEESPLNIFEIKENQTVIERRVKLIDGILLDLMDTVAIESGRLTLSRDAVHLSELVKNICDIHHKKLDVNNNRILYELQSNLPQVLADPMRIEQVMINLLSNALRYTKGGTITIKLTREAGYQTVSVGDDGEGMDAEMVRIALRQYVSTKTEYWRHGIGLHICQRIISAHGGNIRISSEKGRGTTISFSLKEGFDYDW